MWWRAHRQREGCRREERRGQHHRTRYRPKQKENENYRNVEIYIRRYQPRARRTVCRKWPLGRHSWEIRKMCEETLHPGIDDNVAELQRWALLCICFKWNYLQACIMLESPKSAILTLRFVSSKRFSGLRSLRTKKSNVCCFEEHLHGIMDGIALDSRWDSIG